MMSESLHGLFDTHCHFESADPVEVKTLLDRARASGVEHVMAVGGSHVLDAGALAAHRLGCRLALGRDRDQIARTDPAAPEAAGREVELPSAEQLSIASAVGEIGLDYHYSPETRSAQLVLFERQLELANSLDLPVVIHTRDADDDTLGALRSIPVRGIIHCFTGTPSYAKQLLDLGFYISISGIVTFRAADNVRESALTVPDDRLLIETDSPYLAPVPMRGNPNEPSFIVHTCRFLADLRGVAAQDLADRTTANAFHCLGFAS